MTGKDDSKLRIPSLEKLPTRLTEYGVMTDPKTGEEVEFESTLNVPPEKVLAHWEHQFREIAEKFADGKARADSEYPWESLPLLGGAVNDGVKLWCRTQFRGDVGGLALQTFQQWAPEPLRVSVEAAWEIWPEIDEGEDPDYGLVVRRAGAAVNALLEAASDPPAIPPRCPDYYDLNPAPPKPDLKAGDYIELTDRQTYRPARVVSIDNKPPWDMTISFGDEVEHDFVPSIQKWRKIAPPTRLPSLKDVFTAGDWIRVNCSRCPYGRVVQVRDVRLLVAFGCERSWVWPDPLLKTVQKVAGPPCPADPRPFHDRFPVGVWVHWEGQGEGVVIAHEIIRPEEWHPSQPHDHDLQSVSVLLKSGISSTSEEAPGELPWLSPVDRPPVDLSCNESAAFREEIRILHECTEKHDNAHSERLWRKFRELAKSLE